jgi:flagellar basal body rod protein FlgG
MCIITKHDDFRANVENIELYASQHFCVLKSKGDPDYFFTIAPAAENVDAEEEAIVPREIKGKIERGLLEQNNIEIARNLVKIDDDDAED